MKKLIQRLALAGTIVLAATGVYNLGKSNGFRQGYDIGEYDQCKKLDIGFYDDCVKHFNNSAHRLKIKSPMPSGKDYQTFDPTEFISKAVKSGNSQARDDAMMGSSSLDASIECRSQAQSMIINKKVPYVPEMDQLKNRYLE